MPAPKYTDELVNTAAELREGGMTYSAIAQRLGMSKEAAQYHCLKLGADCPKAAAAPAWNRTPKTVARGNHIVRNFTAAEDRRLLALEAEGKTPAEIARILARKRNSIVGRMMTIARRQERAELQANFAKGDGAKIKGARP